MKTAKCSFLLFLLVMLPGGPLFSADLPQIRKIDLPPFTANGTAVESVWRDHADRLGGLVNPRTLGVEFSPTCAQMLYDGENLYIRLRGSFRPEFRSDRTQERSLFADNNFEIFLKGEKSNEYYHIAVSESGLLYTGIGRAPAPVSGIRKFVFTKKDCWLANLVIPLKSIGLTPEEQKIRFNICRCNIDMPKGSEQMSSFAVMEGGQLNYHVPDLWSVAEMTSAPGKPEEFSPHSEKYRINLMSDPGFDYVTRTFSDPDIQRMETQILSGVWLIHAGGNAYHFYSAKPGSAMREGKEYTMKIRARRIGKEGSLGIMQLVRSHNGRMEEGPRIIWGLSLSPDFQEFYIPFESAENFYGFAFYRLGTRGKETGVELENVSLYEGKISPFEIRKVNRAGVKNIVPGTEIRLPDNPYGHSAEPLKVLVIGRRLMALADASELFTGLNVDADMLGVTDKNSDTYYTPGDSAQTAARIERGEYDLYMIGGRDVGERIGVKLAEQIGKNVRKGAGLFWNASGSKGPFAELLGSSGLTEVGGGHLLKQALPVELLNRPAPFQGWMNDPLNALQEGRYGDGRVVSGETFFHHWSGNFMFQMIPDHASLAAGKFPWSDFNKAWLARIMLYAVGKTKHLISGIVIDGSRVSVTGKGLKDGTVLRWKVTGENGETAAAGEGFLRNSRAEIVLPELAASGAHVFSVHALTVEGKTLDYSAKAFFRPGPRIVSLKDRKLYHSGSDPAEIEVTAEGIESDMTLSWSLEDFSGRILERGRADAGENVLLNIPLEPLYTNLGNVEVSLCSPDGQVRSVKRISVFAQDRDRKRLLNDFTPAVWNYEPISPGMAKGSDLQLEKIGIRSYLLAQFYGPATFRTGMGSGDGWLCADFVAFRQNSPIRKPQVNTDKARRSIVQRARKQAEANRQLGLVQSILCDEQGLINQYDKTELDEHPENIAEYRIRMKEKYKTIEAFNRRMGTAYPSFDQLRPGRLADARKSGLYGEFMEWRNFNTDRWCEAIKLVSDAARAGDPECIFSIANTFGEYPLSSTDYWKLTTKTGADFSHEYTSMVYQGQKPVDNFDEFYRSFRPDMRLWGYTGYFFDRAKAFFQPWWFALHRYGGFTWYGTYACLDSTGGNYNLLDYTGAFTQDAANLAEGLKKSRLQDGLGKLFLAYEWSKNEIAVYYSHDSLMVAFLLGKETRNRELLPDSPLSKVFYSRQQAAYSLEELLYQYDFAAPEQITGGVLKGRKALFIPGVISMSDAEVKSVKDFIADGGTVIADFMPGAYDELGVKRNAPPFTTSEITILGTLFDNRDPAQKQRILDVLRDAGCLPLISVADAAKIPGREAMHFVHGDMHVFAILRDQTKSKDSMAQTLVFPVKGHLYDLRTGEYLGFGDQVTSHVASGDAGIWGVYPYKVNAVQIQAPDSMQGGRDLIAQLRILPSESIPGCHILHAELVPPQGEPRFFWKRNLTANHGQAEFRLRIAENDPDGPWTFRVTDVMTGVSAEKTILKK